MSQKGFSKIVLVLIIAIAAGVVGYFGLVRKKTTTDWQDYTFQNLSFKYPRDWKVTEWFLEYNSKKELDGIIVHPLDADLRVREKFINVGGTFDIKRTKTQCKLLDPLEFKCTEINQIPIYTYRKNDAEILKIFELLINSIQSTKAL